MTTIAARIRADQRTRVSAPLAPHLASVGFLTLDALENLGASELWELSGRLGISRSDEMHELTHGALAKLVADVVGKPEKHLGCYLGMSTTQLASLHCDHLYALAVVTACNWRKWSSYTHKEQVQQVYDRLHTNVDAILARHGAWMLAAFSEFPELKLIGKRMKADTSPSTFMFEAEAQTGVYCTWMADPSIEKVRKRKDDWRRWHRSLGTEAKECDPLFTRERVFSYFDWKLAVEGVIQTKEDVDLAKKHEAIVAAMREPRLEPAPLCACGVDLRQNKKYPGPTEGSASICGECQIKLVGPGAWLDTPVGPAAFSMKTKRRVHNPRFDPRPGIDDQGAWSTPAWEEES